MFETQAKLEALESKLYDLLYIYTHIYIKHLLSFKAFLFSLQWILQNFRCEMNI